MPHKLHSLSAIHPGQCTVEKPRISAASHSCLRFRETIPIQLSPFPPKGERPAPPPHLPHKKRPDPFPLDQAVFFFPIHDNGRTNAIQSPPHLFPSIPRQANRRRDSCRAAFPTSRKSWERRGAGGGTTLLQKGFPPPVLSPPTSWLQAWRQPSERPCRRPSGRR